VLDIPACLGMNGPRLGKRRMIADIILSLGCPNDSKTHFTQGVTMRSWIAAAVAGANPGLVRRTALPLCEPRLSMNAM
jgi:hypothetical protein